jgi:DNA-binding GntR family transcriptional regulator
MARGGDIAALLIGKAKEKGKPAQPSTVDCARSVLDAIKADDAEAFDAALRDWCDDYEAEQGEGSDEEG